MQRSNVKHYTPVSEEALEDLARKIADMVIGIANKGTGSYTAKPLTASATFKDPEPHQLLDEKEAADYLAVAPTTLKNSRYLKKLNGRPAPAHMNLGRSVRYKGETLIEWRNRHYTASEADQEAGE